MKIKHTLNSPILLKIIPETPIEAFENNAVAKSLSNIKIPCEVKVDGTLVLNIDTVRKDFAKHNKKR